MFSKQNDNIAIKTADKKKRITLGTHKSSFTYYECVHGIQLEPVLGHSFQFSHHPFEVEIHNPDSH